MYIKIKRQYLSSVALALKILYDTLTHFKLDIEETVWQFVTKSTMSAPPFSIEFQVGIKLTRREVDLMIQRFL